MGSSFHEKRFPTAIAMGATGGPGFLTTILPMSSGFEQRNQNWALSRAEYDVTQGLKSQADLNALIHFFMARRGRLFGFRFKDFNDFQMPFPAIAAGPLLSTDRQTLFTTDGTTATFQIFKLYGDSGNTYQQPLYKIVSSSMSGDAETLKLWNAGVLMVISTDYTYDYTTGIVTLSNAIKATTGNVIAGQCSYDRPVRFDVDKLSNKITDYDINEWGGITLVEVRDI